MNDVTTLDGTARQPAETDHDRTRRPFDRRHPGPSAAAGHVPKRARITTIDLDLGLRGRVVRNLLLEEAGCDDRRSEAGMAGLDIDGVYVAFRARTRPGWPAEKLAAELSASAQPDGEVLVTDHDGDVIGLSRTAALSATTGVAGVGPAVAPDKLIESFPLASRAMEAAIGFGLDGVHGFDDLGLLPAIIADTEVGAALWLRLVRPFDDLECGPEVVAAIRKWFDCGMHVDRAAARLMLHPNTLRNRISRFEALAGVELRDPVAAMQVWWALHYAALAAGTSDATGPMRWVPRTGPAVAGELLRAVLADRERSPRPIAGTAAGGGRPRPIGRARLAARRGHHQVLVDHVRETGSRPGSEVLPAGRDTPAGEVTAAESGRLTADRERAEFVRDLLWATMDAPRLVSAAVRHAVDVDREYLAVRAHPAPGHGVDEIAGALGLGRSHGGGLGAVVNGDLVGFVPALPRHPVCGVAGLGPARPLALLHESFRMATRALHTADRRNMTGICEFGKLGLLPAILSDKAVGNGLCDRYFSPLGETEFAVEIVETLRAYLACGMQAPRAAKVLCVHPNTVRYRVAKFEKLTGVNFRGNRTESFEVLWALEHRAVHSRRSAPQSAAG